MWTSLINSACTNSCGRLYLVSMLLDFRVPSNSMWSTSACSIVQLLSHPDGPDVFAVFDYWWWERVLLGVWMLSMVVLTRSYAGNLMSLLAVRYIPMPIQSLQDVLESSYTFLVQEGTNQLQTIQVLYRP